MISKEKAEEMVKEKVDTVNLRKHMYAVEAIMRELAGELGKDEEKWGLVGLLHDIDYEETKDNPENHARRSAEMLEGELPEDCLHAIRAHNYKRLEADPGCNMDYALLAADAISGLIVATALVMPNKKMEEVRTESVLKKFDSGSFAKGIDRDRILNCEEIGMDKEEFTEVALRALKNVHGKLGL